MQKDKFNFITDNELRSSIESDYKEMILCQENECWKSVNVLSGSIIEAILVDYLVETGKEDRAKLLRSHLSDLIDLAHKNKLISEKSYYLSHSIRNFRNLIHPGRSVRLKDSPNKDQSSISISLVNLISDEIKNKRKVELGYTAEQLTTLILDDYNKIHIANELVNETNDNEILNLLLGNIPNFYFELLEIRSDSKSKKRDLLQLSRFFRKIFNLSDDKIKKKVTSNYIKILKTKDSYYITNYERAFFRCNDLQYIKSKEVQLVFNHLLPRAYVHAQNDKYDVFDGIGKFFEAKDQFENFLFDLFFSVYVGGSKSSKSGLNNFIQAKLLKDINEEKLEYFISLSNNWLEKSMFGDENNNEIKELIKSAETVRKSRNKQES